MTQPYEDDHITRRIVMALDALPVPEEPTGFAATRKSSFVTEPRMIVVTALVLLLIATVTSPPFQHAAAALSRYIERIEFGRPRWVGYYLESANIGAMSTRLRFASSDSQTHPSIVMIGGTTLSHGQWSPDGERITVSDGSQLYVGDRSGRVRPVTDLGAGRVVGQSGWIGNDKVWAVAPSPDFTAGLFVTVELKTGAIEQLPIELRGDLVVSPDGRWGAMNPHESGCDTVAMLFNFATRETVEVVDGRGRPASLSFGGFVRDGRILVQQCDHVAGTVELYVGAPGDRPDLIAVVPITVRYPSVAYNDSTDEILVIASSPDALQDGYVFDPTGHLLRRPHLPQFAREGQGFIATLSRDGRSLGFIANDLNGFSAGARAGVVDLTSGKVTYLCDAGCWYLLVR